MVVGHQHSQVVGPASDFDVEHVVLLPIVTGPDLHSVEPSREFVIGGDPEGGIGEAGGGEDGLKSGGVAGGPP